MKRLAIELSSCQGSLALYEGTQCLEDIDWIDDRFNSQRFFKELGEMIQRHELQIEDLHSLIAGRGPGNFTGLRTSMAALQGLALPHGIELLAISSGYALAWQVLSGENTPRVTVSGDARRNTIWTGTFTQDNGQLRVEKDWHLVSASDFEASLPEDAIHVSPEWERIAHQISRKQHWITQNRYPKASFLVDLIHQTNNSGINEPFEPIYMHPPVEPRPVS